MTQRNNSTFKTKFFAIRDSDPSKDPITDAVVNDMLRLLSDQVLRPMNLIASSSSCSVDAKKLSEAVEIALRQITALLNNDVTNDENRVSPAMSRPQ